MKKVPANTVLPRSVKKVLLVVKLQPIYLAHVKHPNSVVAMTMKRKRQVPMDKDVHAMLLNLVAVLMAFQQLKVKTTKAAKELAKIQFTDVVPTMKHQHTALTSWVAVYSLLSVAVLTIGGQLQVHIVKVVDVNTLNMVAALITALLPKDRITRVVVASTLPLDAVQIDTQRLRVPISRDVDVRHSSLAAALMEKLDLQDQLAVIADILLTAVVETMRLLLPDLTVKDVIVLPANTAAVLMVLQMPKDLNSMAALIFQRINKRFALYPMIAVDAETTQLCGSSMCLMEDAHVSGTAAVMAMAISSPVRRNVRMSAYIQHPKIRASCQHR